MVRLVAVLLLLGTALSATGFIVEPMPVYGAPGYDRWCYNHPYRCHG
jgi:hypothetical protein